MLRIGQKVVCVQLPSLHYAPPAPAGFAVTIGATYTIRDFDVRAFNAGLHSWPTVRLEEIIRPGLVVPNFGYWEPGYVPEAFRPVDETETHLAVPKVVEKTE